MNIGVYEAKLKLSELLEKVRAGGEVVITKHGRPVARIVPIGAPAAADRVRAVRAIRAFSKRLDIRTRVPLRKLIEAGRD